MSDKIPGMAVHVSVEQRSQILGRIDRILEKGWLMWGDEQDELKRKFCERAAVDYAETFNSATSAIEIVGTWLAAAAPDRPPYALVQANSFPSVAMALSRAGLKPVFVDVDRETMQFSGDVVEEALDVYDAVMVVIQHNGGYVTSGVEDVRTVCTNRGVFLLEDCSHAAGSKLNGVGVGHWGDAAVFSMAATKPLQTGQGGMLLTDDAGLVEFAFRAKNYGRTEMFQKGRYVQDGWNAHLTEIQAAVGNVLHESLDDAIDYRQRLLSIMEDTAGFGFDEIRLGLDPAAEPNLYKVPVVLPSGVSADEARQVFAEDNIELGSSIYNFVTPDLEVFSGRFDRLDTPNAAWLAEHHVCLPMHNRMSDDDAVRVGKKIAEVWA